MGILDYMKVFGINKALDYLDQDPDANLPKLMEWVEKFGGNQIGPAYRDVFRRALSDPDNNWYRLIKSMYTDIDSSVLKKMFENFIVNANLLDWPRRNAEGALTGENAPWSVIIDPAYPCDMDCQGCGAAIFGVRPDMEFDGLDEEIEARKARGTYLYIFSSGDPLAREREIIALCNKHRNCLFAAFTPPQSITEELAADMMRVRNLFPAIRADEDEAPVAEAMALLRRWKLPYGAACRCTAENADHVATEEFYDKLIGWGAKFCWFFTCKAADDCEQASQVQLAHIHRRVREFRKTKPLLTLDFWDRPSPSATAPQAELLEGGAL
mgnify:CR=1 FL=1